MLSGMTLVQSPTVADIDAIGATTDPVIRNLRITQCYHELSAAVAERMAPGANWCTFATWASKQAGQTIRGEDFARAVNDLFGSREVAALVEGLMRLATRDAAGLNRDRLIAAIRRAVDPEAALRRAADAVAVGNRKVFIEIGREFARWRTGPAANGAPDATATAAFCAGLRPGEPPDGQRLLRDAFGAYGETCRAPNEHARASLLLLGNLLIGLHEQTRLQPEIQASLDASVDPERIRAELLPVVFPGMWIRMRAQIARLTGRPMPADVAIDVLVDGVRQRLRLVLTDLLMTLRMPGTTLRLGSDVPGEFPPELRQLENPQLQSLLATIDPTPSSTARSGAADWADLAERMHYIADLFRCWHARPELFSAPFTAGQVALIRDGKRPPGDL
jgi:hypothetical protein